MKYLDEEDIKIYKIDFNFPLSLNDHVEFLELLLYSEENKLMEAQFEKVERELLLRKDRMKRELLEKEKRYKTYDKEIAAEKKLNEEAKQLGIKRKSNYSEIGDKVLKKISKCAGGNARESKSMFISWYQRIRQSRIKRDRGNDTRDDEEEEYVEFYRRRDANRERSRHLIKMRKKFMLSSTTFSEVTEETENSNNRNNNDNDHSNNDESDDDYNNNNDNNNNNINDTSVHINLILLIL